MKRLILLLIITSTAMFALDKLSSLPTNQKALLDKVVERLKLPNDISNETKEKIFNQFSGFMEKDWSARWTHNNSTESSKLGNSDTHVMDLMIYNNNRIINVLYVYFSKEKQIFSSLKQYVSTDKNSAMTLYKEHKSDSKYEKSAESDNYAYFTEKGYVSYDGFYIKDPAGMVIYESTSIFDVK